MPHRSPDSPAGSGLSELPTRSPHRLVRFGLVLAIATGLAVLGGVQASATPIGGGRGPVVPNSVTSTVDTSGSPANTYRIPAMAQTADGTLIACYDSRNNSSADLPSDIDIVCRRSHNEGTTWDARTIAVAHTGGNTDAAAAGVGDGSLLYDPVTGKLWLSYLESPAGIGLANSSTDRSATSVSTVHPQIRYSTDDGLTWSAAGDLTALKPSGATGIFASSGHGVVLANGTLVQPYAYDRGSVSYAALAYSTDHGTTWQLGTTIGAGLSENKIAQRADGTLLDDARSTDADYRVLATAAGPASTWSTPTANTALPDPHCNGDVLTLPNGWLLESNPGSPTSRSNGVVRESRDGGATWPYTWTIQPGAFGYSTMVELQPGTVGILYETQSPAGLTFQRFAPSARLGA